MQCTFTEGERIKREREREKKRMKTKTENQRTSDRDSSGVLERKRKAGTGRQTDKEFYRPGGTERLPAQIIRENSDQMDERTVGANETRKTEEEVCLLCGGTGSERTQSPEAARARVPEGDSAHELAAVMRIRLHKLLDQILRVH